MELTLQHKEFELSDDSNDRAKSFLALDKKIVSGIVNLQVSYLEIAKALYEISENKLYYYFTFSTKYYDRRSAFSVEEYAMARFGMSRKTVNQLLGIWKAFAAVNGGVIGKYENYSFSQLEELLPLCKSGKEVSCAYLPEWVNENVKPETTVKEIRALKREFKKVKEKNKKSESPAEEKPETDVIQSTDDVEVEEENDGAWRILKNDKERKIFLENYHAWSVCAINEFLGLIYYRCKLSDGSYVIALEWKNTESKYSRERMGGVGVLRYIKRVGKEFHLEPLSVSSLVTILRTENLNVPSSIFNSWSESVINCGNMLDN